ncbi:hypothetical protein ACOMHN_059258 [Nucella lapillus]
MMITMAIERAWLVLIVWFAVVIVMTNGSTSIFSWRWDTITMVVTTYFERISQTGLTACIAHAKGKRYGLRELVPGSNNITEFLVNYPAKKKDFMQAVTTYQDLLMADHVVFDLVVFFHRLEHEQLPAEEKTEAIRKMDDVLSATIQQVHAHYKSEVYCVVPWVPPCPTSNCTVVKELLKNCHILLLSPDSYMPTPDSKGQCQAQATVPIAKFLYGVDRYMALQVQPNVRASIVAGVPWHGYTYKCDHFSGERCIVNSTADGRCFDSSNRRRHSLSEIHNMNIPEAGVKLDQISKGLYYTKNDTAQMWFENFTTLYIKYHLVTDLQLKGLSIWYGEDLVVDLSTGDTSFTMHSWGFMTHQMLHQVAASPPPPANTSTQLLIEVQVKVMSKSDTVAGVGIGCLLLGTILGVIFTYIALQRRNFRRINRPFKLDEVEDEFRDDEGL